MRFPTQKIKKSFFYFLFLFFLFEFFSIIVVNLNLWTGTIPPYSFQGKNFFYDLNKDFGAWHFPNNEFRHKKSCFDAIYATNSFGMKDSERSLKSEKERTLVIGDSMVEGYGLSNQDTITSNLQKIKGKEYLNFGTSGHFGSTQMLLMYKSMASKFDHTEVLLFLTPWNDFEDDSYDFGINHHKKRYRPYKIKVNEKFQLEYPMTDLPKAEMRTVLKDFYSSFSASYHVLKSLYKFIYTILYQNNQISSVKESGYFSFTPKGIDLLIDNIINLEKESITRNAKTTVILIPTLGDFLSNDNKNPETPLYKELKAKLPMSNIVDLYYEILKEGISFEKLFLPCDGHLSPLGSKVIAEILSKKI